MAGYLHTTSFGTIKASINTINYSTPMLNCCRSATYRGDICKRLLTSVSRLAGGGTCAWKRGRAEPDVFASVENAGVFTGDVGRMNLKSARYSYRNQHGIRTGIDHSVFSRIRVLRDQSPSLWGSSSYVDGAGLERVVGP